MEKNKSDFSTNLRSTIDKKIETFTTGMGNSTIMLMTLIYILIGVFTALAQSIGAIDSVVKIIQVIVPHNFIVLGIFLMASLISVSIGTSCGTIAALTPIALLTSKSLGLDDALVLGCVVGGSMFGDNLSIISDTTIAASQTQHIALKDKTRYNFRIVLIPFIICMILYSFEKASLPTPTQISIDLSDFFKITPYLFLFGLGIYGMNVILLLLIGILLNCILGFSYNLITSKDLFPLIGKGSLTMSNIIVIALLLGGTLEIVRQTGLLKKIISVLQKTTSNLKRCELGICFFTGLVNIFTGSNTISLIIAGPIVHEISIKNALNPKRIASLIDITSCVIQGLIPYGAQILIPTALANISPFAIIKNTYYPIVLGVFLILSILTQKKKS